MAARNVEVLDSVQAHIVVTPDVAHGRPRIAGHRIRVQDIAVWYERMGMTPDEMADEYELTLGEIYAARAYYFDHRQEILSDIARDRKFVAELKKQNPSRVKAKLKERFSIVIEKAEANYACYAPDLPGCVATGKTRNQATRNMYDAIELHVRGLIADNLSVPKSRVVGK